MGGGRCAYGAIRPPRNYSYAPNTLRSLFNMSSFFAPWPSRIHCGDLTSAVFSLASWPRSCMCTVRRVLYNQSSNFLSSTQTSPSPTLTTLRSIHLRAQLWRLQVDPRLSIRNILRAYDIRMRSRRRHVPQNFSTSPIQASQADNTLQLALRQGFIASSR
jgi:hypothetical protein